MEGVGLRVKNEGKCVSCKCPFDIEGGGGHFKLSSKIRSSSIYKKNLGHLPFLKKHTLSFINST